MARAVENKATEAHRRAVDRIKEILGVDETEARAYKAIIWESLKESQKEMSNYDKSMELEKKASDKDYLKSISKSEVSKMTKIISEKQKDRESSSASTPTEKPKRERKTMAKRPKSADSTESGLDTVSSIDI
jgi:hypothetical protein